MDTKKLLKYGALGLTCASILTSGVVGASASEISSTPEFSYIEITPHWW